MGFRLLTPKDSNTWKDLLTELNYFQQDTYYSPEYYQLFENNGFGLAKCFYFYKGNHFVLYPFLLNSVNNLGYSLEQNYYDIQGVYGYNGIVSNTTENSFLSEFYDTFDQFCSDENIIAEFIRYNPILKNHELEQRFEPIYILDNVMIDVSNNIDEIWKNSFDNGVRKAVKKGIRNNLIYDSYTGEEISDDYLHEFLKIYYSTMHRNKAKNFYYFTKQFFYNMQFLIPKNIHFSYVKKDEKIISVELNIVNKLNSYGFLGGTLAEYFSMSPNSFLRFELIKDLKKRGVKNYSIGGGITKNDSKYKFKKSFSKKIDQRFYIGKKIHNNNIYSQVVTEWEKNSGHISNNLLRYRD